MVEHRSTRGTARRFDFATLPVPLGMQRSLAAVFAELCRPDSGWDSHDVARTNWNAVRAFATYLSQQDRPVGDVDALTVGLWNAWRISRPNTPAGQQQLRCVIRLLRHHPS
ncbi:hypothetical protein ACWD1Z_37315, partial [Streptomyces sp. NPDC002784]